MSGYDEKIIESTRRKFEQKVAKINTIHRRIPKVHYLKLPFISDKVNHAIHKAIKKYDLPIKLAQRSNTLINFFDTQNKYREKCTVGSCLMRSDICSSVSEVYQLQWPGCTKRYVGSTMRQAHFRFNEHHKYDKKSSVFKHYMVCKKIFKHKTLIISESLQKLIFDEARFIKLLKPELNCKEELSILNLII